MKLFGVYALNAEIESIIENGIDEETGEISEEAIEKLNELTIAKEEKLENIALWVKDIAAEQKKVREEKKKFDQRLKALENKEARLRQYLADGLQGEKFKTSKVNVYYLNTKSVEIDPDTFFARSANCEYFRFHDPEAKKDEIKKALESGKEIEGARLVSNTSLTIR